MIKLTIKTLKVVLPVLVSMGVISSCKKDDDDNGKNCNEDIDYTKCITCTTTYTYSNGLPTTTDNDALCPSAYNTLTVLQDFVNSHCLLDGTTYQGSGYTVRYTVDCHNN